MQGQRSAIGSLPDSINIDYGSLPNSVGVDDQIFWNNLRNPSDTYTGNVGQEGQNPMSWSFGDLSPSNPENQVNHDEQMTQSSWSPSLDAAPSSSLRLEPVSQTGVDLNLSSNQPVSIPPFVRSSDPNTNEGQRLRSGNNMDYPSSSKHVGFESKPSASSSTDPSGSGGFLLEEDDGRPGCSMDGHRRLSCKRKTLEGNVGHSSSNEGFLPRLEGGSIWPQVRPQYNASSNMHMHVSSVSEGSSSVVPPIQVNPRLGLDLGRRVSSDSFRALNVHRGPDASHRTFNLRTNVPNQQDSTPGNSFLPLPATAVRHPDIPLVQPSFRPVNPPLDLMSPIPPDNSVRANQNLILRVPALRQNVQSLRWNGGPNFRLGNSTTPTMPIERDNVVPENSNPRSASRSIANHLMFVPPSEGRGLSQNATNWGPTSSGNVGIISRNVTSTSRTRSSLGSQSSSSGPSWVSYRHPPSQHSRRLSEYVRRSLMSTTVPSENGSQIGNSSSNQFHSEVGSSQETVRPPGVGNDVHSQTRSSSVPWLERQGNGAVRFPYSLRALAAAGEGRSRLVSEIRNALDIMRRGEGLRFEDVMVLDQSVFFGMADIHDQHRDMRLDVDNMSYEELLALEERIGNVCTGLSEETILKRMKQHKFIHTIDGDQIDAEPCCVCQEAYNDGDDLGTLDCGHNFHRDCIKQWLTQKNLCPICKTTALAT